MALYEPDILNAFRALGRWMAERGLKATAIVDGGAALLFQTYLRDHATDIDMRFDVVSENGTLYDDKQKKELLENFAACVEQGLVPAIPAGTKIDAEHAQFMKDPARLILSQTTIPFADYRDVNGNGITVQLVSLEGLLRSADSKASYYVEERSRVSESHSDAQELEAQRDKARRDYYGIFEFLHAERKAQGATFIPQLCMHRPKSEEVADIKARVQRGRKHYTL